MMKYIRTVSQFSFYLLVGLLAVILIATSGKAQPDQRPLGQSSSGQSQLDHSQSGQSSSGRLPSGQLPQSFTQDHLNPHPDHIKAAQEMDKQVEQIRSGKQYQHYMKDVAEMTKASKAGLIKASKIGNGYANTSPAGINSNGINSIGNGQKLAGSNSNQTHPQIGSISPQSQADSRNPHRKGEDRNPQSQVDSLHLRYYPLLIFVSTSIPKPSLAALMISAKKAGGVLVFRGLIEEGSGSSGSSSSFGASNSSNSSSGSSSSLRANVSQGSGEIAIPSGSLAKTAQFLAALSKDNVSAIIDPRLFSIFGIESVPTVVVLKDSGINCGSDQMNAMSGPMNAISDRMDIVNAPMNTPGECNLTPIHDRIVGNVTLEYVLEQFKENGDTKATSTKLLANLKAEEWQ